MAERAPRSIQRAESVRAAMREYDVLGRGEFLAKYKIGAAQKFVVMNDGQTYDAKAILEAAYRVENPDEEPLATGEFEGDEPTVRKNLDRLGFDVRDIASLDSSARSINEIQSRKSIVSATAEYDEIGQEAFLSKYGFSRANRFFLEIDGRRYDSKAVVGAAYHYEFPDRHPLRSSEFSGGAATVQPLLERLGFNVVVDEGRNYWWVNQGGSYKRARERGELTAPAAGREGRRSPAHWSNMARLREGDLVFHYSQGNLRAVGRVTAPAREADVALPGYNDETEHVRLARVEYFDLEPIVRLEQIPVEWRQFETKPFNRTGGVNQGYLYPVSEEFSQRLESQFPSIADQIEAAREFRRAPRRWCIYVPRAGAENFRIGRRESVWGVPKLGRLAGLQSGDQVVLVHDMGDDGTPRPPSFPRVSLEDFHGRASQMVTVRLTSDPYIDDQTVWPDAEYPERFRFAEESEEERVDINAQTYPADVRDAIRRSALEGGKPMPVDEVVSVPVLGYEEPPFDAIESSIREQGLSIEPSVLRRYHLSLKTRGFVILSGLSGSGKTWITGAYAKAVGARYELAPVAPNWTSNEDLLGYFNPLDNRYVDTPFSRFLREANAAYAEATRAGVTPPPFHLVLDEMNLARVEYYFAKFLSAMELRARHEPAPIELAPGEDVSVPPNLMFVGTVNIDETTHQFADKVYDRAQLIELGIDEDQVTAHLGDAEYAAIVLEVWSAVQELAPFAFRTLDEISSYVEEAGKLGVPWQTALDEQLVQKVLPKLKGANPRTGHILSEFSEVAAEFPLSLKKAQRMKKDFDAFGITSYF